MKKLRKQAKEMLHGAHKVYHYRRDVIHEGRLQELEKAVQEVDILATNKDAKAEPLEAAMRRLDALLKKIGGKIYPKTFFSDNIEVLLVAAILVLGIRTFFFQPFIIPTNSMYPTYSGMNAVVYSEAEQSPGVARKVINKLTLGASHYRLDAPVSGEIKIPLFSQAPNSPDARLRGMGLVRFDIVAGRKWFGILPAQKREYSLVVGDQITTLQVPLDFSLDEVIRQRFFPEVDDLGRFVYESYQAGRINMTAAAPLARTGEAVQAGEPALEFDITLGDALFVDRFSYHFVSPKAGDPFVFRTRDIPGVEGGPGNIVDKYYIKRIGGVGGETIEIRDYALLVDGEPRTEVAAFERNARREGEYSGYINQQRLGEGRRMQIEPGHFIALGDNSANSLDSRYWGQVPEHSVIGKALFIYYPFTTRWGRAE